MTFTHSLIVLFAGAIFLAIVLKFIMNRRLRIKYALVWIGIGLMAVTSPFLYDFALWLHDHWNFPTPSILLLIGALLLICLVCLQLTASVSKAHRERAALAREIALMNQKLEMLERSQNGG